ncbi:MAG: ribosome biogenesis GTPase Der [Xanthobacteraceae bacterium]|nr:ribosome biogenesis GTPase Der [Xanthobacteraceae bacterium]
MLPSIAIVGRPNVGKSTLFNRLVGQRVALVDDTPGVTRDRREGEGKLGDLKFRIFDTAGFEEAGAESLAGRMRAQTESAIADADAILFLVDARAGLLPDDKVFAQIVRKSGKPAVVVANKSEGKAGAAGALEAYALGLGEPVNISAEHGEGMGELYDALVALLPEKEKASEFDEDGEDGADEKAEAEKPADTIRVAVVGRPNAGKSTLINKLIGEDRLVTGPEPGITRDSIEVKFEYGGRKFEMLDTAGMRKRAKVQAKLEKLSVGDTLRAIRFAEVVVLLLDATMPFEEQDLRIADLVMREGRGLVIGMNKRDLAAPEMTMGKTLREEADHWLPQAKGMPIVAMSGMHGDNLDKLMKAVVETYEVWNKRVSTSTINRFLERALSQNPPPAVSGARIKLRYMTQAKARPPTFVLFGTRTDALPESYMRYLVNGVREAFEMPGVPIRFTFREPENPFRKKMLKKDDRGKRKKKNRR